MSSLQPAAFVVAALVVTAAVANEPAAAPDSPSTSTTAEVGSGHCDPGYVCGTCPDGSTWDYLDDPAVINDPVLSRLIFDVRNPCG